MHSIKTLEFRSPIGRDNSYTSERVAEDAHSTMELYVCDDKGHLLIEWVIDPPVDEVEHIGVWVKHPFEESAEWFTSHDGQWVMMDYDGVFELPPQAIELLESVGITVPEEFRS